MKKYIALFLSMLLLLPSCGQTPAAPSEPSKATSDISETLSSNEAEGRLPDASTDNVDTVEDPYARKLCDHRIRWQVETEDCEKGAALRAVCSLCGTKAMPLALASFAHAYTVIDSVSSEGVAAKCAYCGKAAVLREKQSFEDFDRDESHFTYTLQEDGTVVITSYTGDAKKIYFPAELDGHKAAAIDLDGNMKWAQDLDSNGNGVTEIGGGITEVAIAPGIQRIEARSFCKWVSLEEIYLFEGLVSVGDAAFARTSLQKVYLPDGLKTLGEEVFARSNLCFLSIPASVEKIDTPASLAFHTDMSDGFFVAEENQNFSSVDGALCSKDGKTVYLIPDQLLLFTSLSADE